MFGYQFVADRLIFDKKKYETLPTAMEYKINLQRDANDYVRQQCQILYNYVFTDIPLTHYNYPQEYLPNDQVNNLIMKKTVLPLITLLLLNSCCSATDVWHRQ